MKRSNARRSLILRVPNKTQQGGEFCRGRACRCPLNSAKTRAGTSPAPTVRPVLLVALIFGLCLSLLSPPAARAQRGFELRMGSEEQDLLRYREYNYTVAVLGLQRLYRMGFERGGRPIVSASLLAGVHHVVAEWMQNRHKSSTTHQRVRHAAEALLDVN